MFDQLRKNVSKLIKKITITDISPKSVAKITKELKDVLIKNEVAVATADAICENLTSDLLQAEHTRFSNPKPLVLSSLRKVLLDILSPKNRVDLLEMVEEAKKKNVPLTIAFFGVNGVGKTLSIAKIGKMLQEKGYSCVFAAGDTFRAGSIQQLQQHGEKLGIRVIAQTYGSDAAAVAFDAVNHAIARNIDVVLIDTAGRIETSSNLMSELQKICKVVEPDLKIFVGDALTGNSLVSQVTLFNEKIGIDASILNKIDADVKGGAAVSVTHISNSPIIFLGNGQEYKDIELFSPEFVVNNIVPAK
ncbi:MAG: signal recognition particle-docking protein FtsY [Candidatus Heimdallarchaeota archaeon]|nr:signal recognition particle-docking protein FtsY [Candidatus Heimdallarchaeota archaeon]MCK4252820.1 signal recognition particle-docking protein FtsY [Candidatus Heimdallarchaeota archaeon]